MSVLHDKGTILKIGCTEKCPAFRNDIEQNGRQNQYKMSDYST